MINPDVSGSSGDPTVNTIEYPMIKTINAMISAHPCHDTGVYPHPRSFENSPSLLLNQTGLLTMPNHHLNLLSYAVISIFFYFYLFFFFLVFCYLFVCLFFFFLIFCYLFVCLFLFFLVFCYLFVCLFLFFLTFCYLFVCLFLFFLTFCCIFVCLFLFFLTFCCIFVYLFLSCFPISSDLFLYTSFFFGHI